MSCTRKAKELQAGDEVRVISNEYKIYGVTKSVGGVVRAVYDASCSVYFPDLADNWVIKKENLKLKGESMTLNVNIKTEGKKKDKAKDYRQLVIDKIVDLGGFWFDKASNELAIGLNIHANDDGFIVCGLLQIILKDVAYFCSGDRDYGFLLELRGLKTWKDVYKKIKDIDSITYNLEV